MIQLPTQFDAHARHSDATAAAGGSTSTTCSSCIVTLGAGSVLTSMYFGSLPSVARPDTGDEPTQGVSNASTSLLGFFLLALSLGIAVLGVVLFSVNGFYAGMLGPLLGLGVWLGVWARVHQQAGKSALLGGVLGLAAIVALVLCTALEMWVWIGL